MQRVKKQDFLEKIGETSKPTLLQNIAYIANKRTLHKQAAFTGQITHRGYFRMHC
jgi:hypothetical protein